MMAGGWKSSPSIAGKLLCVLGLLMAVVVITVPLTLRQQWLFAIGTICALLIVNQSKSRRATLIVCFLTTLVSTRYIWWRTTETLSFDSPVALLLGVALYLAELYAWLILVLGFVQTSWPLQRPALLPRRTPDYWPTVDVYVPTYNESLSIVRTTVFAAMAMDYPRDRFRVFILDDGRRPEFRDFARMVGCGYLTRPDNAHAKAGNLNAALKRTDGELICVFDCDHVPTRAFLQMTTGWFQQDPKLALLQTPHYFYSPDPVQRNVSIARDMPGEGELFYGPIQMGNDLWNAAFFCGSCAVIRRAALEETSGFAWETVTEDAHTALKLQRAGWNTAYLNMRLSAGLATERLLLHIGQRIRWARGMTQIFRIDNPLLGPGLSLAQRVCYLNAMLYFQFPLARIIFLTLPLAYLFAGQNVIHASAAMIFAYVLPHLVASLKSSERIHGSTRRPFWGEIYDTLLAFHLVKPTLLTLINPRKGKFNVTDKGATLEDGFFDHHTLRPHLLTVALLLLGLVTGFAKLLFPETFDVHLGTLLLNAAWTTLSLLILIAAISVGRERRQTRQHVRFDVALPVTLYFDDGHVVDARTVDVSMGGFAIRAPESFDPAGRTVTDVGLSVRNRVVTIPVHTVWTAGRQIGVRFEGLSLENESLLVEALMGRADAWQHTVIHKPRGSIGSIMDIAGIMGTTLAAGIGFIRHPRQWARVLAALMAALFGVAALLAAMGGVAYANPPAAGPEPAQSAVTATNPGSGAIRLTLQDLGIGDRIRLAGTQGEIGIPFGLREDEAVSGAQLTLNFAYSPSLLPDLSQLVVLLNGEVVRSIALPRETADGIELTIPVEAALFAPGDNRLNLRLVAHYARGAENPMSSALWANISNVRSFLQLNVQKLPARRDLSLLPAPFYDRYQMQPLQMPFVFGGAPSDGELEAAASAAGWLGALASYRGYAFKPVTAIPATGDAIVFVLPRHPVPGIAVPPVNGPALAIVANPHDNYGSLLLVMGRDERELKLAAAALATSGGTLGGASASVAGVRVPVTERYAAARWLPTDRPVSLGEIVAPPSLQGQGLPPGPLTASFRIAPDLFFWPRSGARLSIGYTYPRAPWLDRRASRLDLSLNGQYLQTLRLFEGWSELLHRHEGTTSRHDRGEAILPPYALYGQNELTFYYDLQLASRPDNGSLPTNVKVGIDPTSTIDLRGAHHAALMPNLALLAGAGFPFTRTPDLGETLILLPAAPTASEIEAFLALMGRFADSTGNPPTRVMVARSISGDLARGKDILVVGRAAMLQGRLFANAPVRWNGHGIELAGRSLLGRAWDFMAPQPETQTLPLDQATLTTDALKGVASFRSPFDPARSVVAFFSSQADDLPDLAYALMNRELNAAMQGDLALMSGDRIQSFRAGGTYWSGTLPWWVRLGYWLSQHPLLLAMMALLAAVLLALPAHALLKAQQRRRLGQEEA